MSEFNWCHGPKCHTHHTQDRIRGVKGSKVLRTKKVAQTSWNVNNMYSHFCSQGCWNDFAYANWNEFINLHPRNEPLETPIDVVKEQTTDWRGQPYIQTKIIPCDNIDNGS
jgi:hypothetical protein|tara:strand:- start:180 stop:512 length:333 start_codon:yes stop_codon:yes gene_type:complete